MRAVTLAFVPLLLVLGARHRQQLVDHVRGALAAQGDLLQGVLQRLRVAVAAVDLALEVRKQVTKESYATVKGRVERAGALSVNSERETSIQISEGTLASTEAPPDLRTKAWRTEANLRAMRLVVSKEPGELSAPTTWLQIDIDPDEGGYVLDDAVSALGKLTFVLAMVGPVIAFAGSALTMLMDTRLNLGHQLAEFRDDYKWLTDVYESVRPADITGRLVWHALGAKTIETANRVELIARVRVDGDRVFEPRLHKYRVDGQTIGTPSVRVGPTNDVYLALAKAPSGDGGAIGLRVIVQPLIVWLWIGGIVMVLGTLLALFPGRRRRNPLDPVSAPLAVDGPKEDPTSVRRTAAGGAGSAAGSDDVVEPDGGAVDDLDGEDRDGDPDAAEVRA